eukprot:CAMPEP_0172165908 /NCGR_PEP_ID=MMETSP1050-20130122/8676_1 /TAXON_ID=233186 /ORGANISM="Cryptomonas curvata, Strain CCAP979/52" /LENGTH=154 /DNA_ID=CAMNT_0012836437 /DNA_START=106 /DNA_END=566 /DNA_ORIENTATION=+
MHTRLLLVVVLALTALVRWESNAAQIRTLDRLHFLARTRSNCFNLNTLRGGGEKHSTRSKQSEPAAADTPSPPSDSEASSDGPTEKPADSLAQMDAAPEEEEERFSYMKIAEKEVRDAEVKEAKRNKEVDEYYSKRERGEIKLPEEQEEVRDTL